jgi:hypothetical protein
LIASYELYDDGDSMAALNFQAVHPHAFTDESLEFGGVFATHVALAWSTMRRQDQYLRIAHPDIATIQHQADLHRSRADRQRTSAQAPKSVTEALPLIEA